MSNASQVVLPGIAQERLTRLQARTASIGVIGLGYVGLPLSLLLSDAGFKVTGFDIDAKKVVDLEAGRSYIFRIAKEEIQSAREQGFTATTDFAHLSEQDAIILCVPTPLTEHREPDLSYVEKIQELRRALFGSIPDDNPPDNPPAASPAAPANVVTKPPGVILRMVLLPVSAT